MGLPFPLALLKNPASVGVISIYLKCPVTMPTSCSLKFANVSLTTYDAEREHTCIRSSTRPAQAFIPLALPL